jgi:hypothetical protein
MINQEIEGLVDLNNLEKLEITGGDFGHYSYVPDSNGNLTRAFKYLSHVWGDLFDGWNSIDSGNGNKNIIYN